MKKIGAAAAAVSGVLAVLAGCLTLGGGGRGPLDSFSFLAANNPGLTRDAVGVIAQRGDPLQVEVVVPPGTDRGRLVATLILGSEATITVISSGNRVIQENSLTPNDFSVPVIYALELPRQKKPLRYRVTVREADTNPLLAQIGFPDGYVLQPAFDPSVTGYTVEVPYGAQSVKIQARGQSPHLVSITMDSRELRGAAGIQAVDFASGQQREVTLTTLAEDGETRAQYRILMRRGEPDRNTLLATLELPGTALNPAFAPAVLSYRALVPFETVRFALAASPQSRFAKVALLGSTGAPLPFRGNPADKDGALLDFPAGDRLAVIVAVTAQDGGTREYLLELSRRAPDRNNRLAALAVEGITLIPAFSESQLAYKGTVPFGAKQVRLCVAAKSKVAAVALEPGGAAPRTAEGRLQYAGNPAAAEGAVIAFAGTDLLNLVVAVTAQDGSLQRYTVDLRRGPPDTNADLKSLSASAGVLSPAFTAKLISYALSLPGGVESVELTAAAASPVALVSVLARPELKPAAVQVVPVAVPPGGAIGLSVLVSAEDGTQRLYLIQVRSAASPAGAPEGTEPTATEGSEPTSGPPPATAPAAGQDSLVVTAKGLRLEAREAEALTQRGETIAGVGRLVVRYYRSQEVLLQASLPVQTRRQGKTWTVSLEHRSTVSLDRERLVEIEVSIPTSGGGVLHYTEARRSDGEISLELPFLLYGRVPGVAWPPVGSAASVAGYLSLLPPGRSPGERPAEREEFQKNDKGEYGITVELADGSTGTLLSRETVWSKPGLPRRHVFAFAGALQVTEGSSLRYVLTATARNGRIWRASGTALVWTTRPKYAGGFEPVLLLLADELAPQ